MKSQSTIWVVSAALTLLLLILPGCASVPAGEGAANNAYAPIKGHEEGARLYRKKCIECHGLHSPRNYTDQQWVQLMNDMAGEARLTQAQNDTILAYLQAAN